jgi:hypothetical protein
VANINFVEPEWDMSDMNEQDRVRITALETKLDTMNSNLSRLLNAVIGDDQAGSIGLVVRIARLEEKMAKNWQRFEATEERIEKLESANTKIFAYSAAIAVVLSTLFNVGRFLFDVLSK